MRVRAVLLAVLAALVVAVPARADTWDVIGTGDGGECNVSHAHVPVAARRDRRLRGDQRRHGHDQRARRRDQLDNDLVIQSDITVIGKSARDDDHRRPVRSAAGSGSRRAAARRSAT